MGSVTRNVLHTDNKIFVLYNKIPNGKYFLELEPLNVYTLNKERL